MKPRDKNYLRLQFWNRIYQKSGTEFQSFFEDIMKKAFPDFQLIRPYGNKGDGGNDGYRPDKGIYYQVYSPDDPSEKEAEAAKKLKADFGKLKSSWDKISQIKEYYFVFNDKGQGVSIEIESALADLRPNNKKIKFGKFTPTELENVFFTLAEDQILSLGFDIDSTKALRVAQEYLSKLEVELDRDNTAFVIRTIDKIRDIVSSLDNDDLDLEFEIFEARALQKNEEIQEAREKFESLAKRYPDDPRPFLYLAEIWLNLDELKKNKAMLKKAEAIEKGHWLLSLEKLIRSYFTDEKVDLNQVDEKSFPNDKRLKANFYRIYAGHYEESGDSVKADSFLEKANKLNPDKFSSYDTKLSILERRYFAEEDKGKRLELVELFLSEVESIETIIQPWGEIGSRNKAIICYRKFNASRMKEDLPAVEQYAKDCFELILKCYFDHTIDNLLIGILTFVELPESDLKKLFDYLDKAQKQISDDLAKRLIFQFSLKETLFTDGKEYFAKHKNKKFADFISALADKKYDAVLSFLADDSLFAVAIANIAKHDPELRLKIIESLPNDGSVQKEKLLLLLSYDEGDMDKAFDLLKGFDLSEMGYLESRQVLKIAQSKKAWDFIIVLLENLLQHEKGPKLILQLKLDLFTANFNLDKFREAAQIGEEILADEQQLNFLSDRNKENLLGQTVLSKINRGEFRPAKQLLESYPTLITSHDFVLGVKADVYLKNNDAQRALEAIVEGVGIIKTPTPEQYARLFLYFTEIGNRMDLPLTSLESVINNSFVKLKDQDQWYFVGEDEELDATKVVPKDDQYQLFLGKKIGESIEFEEKYRATKSKHEIELIFPIERYILWQCRHFAEKLTVEKRWKGMEIIDVPSTADGGIDPKYLIARLEDDKKSRGDFFDMYSQKRLPLAFLAVNQGGLPGAIGTIQMEQKGYIHFSSGDLDEINQQKEIAKRIIGGEKFYIDGTSALVLSETGLLADIYKHLSGLTVPQSVITLLLEINDKFRVVPGQAGNMAYSQGRLVFSSVDPEKRRKIRSNFLEAIKLLESKPENVEAISEANKTGEFSERSIEPALSDACILAQRDQALVLTEDFTYLKVNELETKKTAPVYCSAFSLVRVLCEIGEIGFDKYLAFFSYLASYRFRFLPITVEDIEKSVFGDGDIKAFTPENIRLLNFPLTLSEDYGVPFDRAFPVVGRFLVKVLMDDALVPEMVDKIFVEILETFPTKNKKELGQMFLTVSVRVINNLQKRMVFSTKVQEKVDSLARLIEIYDGEGIILP